MARFSLCSPAHTRVEPAGHSEHAPEVLTEDVSVGWDRQRDVSVGWGLGLGLGLVFHS